jgi:Kef-type K+ transport system membrane component KefB
VLEAVPFQWVVCYLVDLAVRVTTAAIMVTSGFRTASAAGTTDYSTPIATTFLTLAIIFISGKLGASIFQCLHSPAVIGELVAGIVLGNLALLHPWWNYFEPLRAASVQMQWQVVVDGFAQVGAILLLLEVGLQSDVQGMMEVGASSLVVGLLGFIVPFVLGYGLSSAFMTPSTGAITPAGIMHLFVGLSCCATSIGITSRMFRDFGKLHTKEAQVVLGAALIDHILALLMLAIVAGVVSAAKSGGPIEDTAAISLIGVSFACLGGALAFGRFALPHFLKHLARFKGAAITLATALLFGFGCAWISVQVGFSALVGAFAAGLVLQRVRFGAEGREIDRLIRPISALFVPFFFVLMGIQVRLETLANVEVLAVGGVLTAAAILGKLISSAGALEDGLDRTTIGVGMIPRGKVGLILAATGKALDILNDSAFSAVILMVVATTLIAPPVLGWILSREMVKSARS